MRREDIPAETEQTIIILNTIGCSDVDIGRSFGRSKHWAAARRRLLGLPSNRYNEVHRAKWRTNLTKFLRDNGCKTFHEFRQLCHRVQAAARGWPADLCAREVAILELLEDGPKTKYELAGLLGLKPGRSCLQNASRPHRSYLVALVRRGLVTMQRRGNRPAIYSLVPEKRRPRAVQLET
jgi:hypothetical protein